MRMTSQVPFCSASYSHDTYRGCESRCVYCFSQNRNDAKGARTFQVSPYPRSVIPAAMIGIPLALHVGGMSDPLPLVENEENRTSWLLENVVDRPIILSTKRDVRRFPRVLRLLEENRRRVLLQVSICADDPDRLAWLDGQSTPALDERLAGLEVAAGLGIPTLVRLQPYDPLFWRNLPRFVKRLHSAGVQGVTVEHLKYGAGCTKWDRLEQACNALGIPLGQRTERQDKSRTLKEKIKNYVRVSGIVHSCGMACFAADNQLRGLGDSPYCCGQELIPDFTAANAWDNYTAIGWDSRIIDSARTWRYGDTPMCHAATMMHGLCQASAGKAVLKRMTWGDALSAWATKKGNVRSLFPYAEQIGPGKWLQTENWWKFCQSVRRPLPTRRPSTPEGRDE